MPPHSARKPNRRQQKAIRRSSRLAEKRALNRSSRNDVWSSQVDGTTPNIGSGMDVEDGQPPHKILCPRSQLEQLPSELVLLIGERLPVASRIALALTSHTMMFKSGGIGPGTNNVATDDIPGHGSENESEGTTSARPSALMELLELLERDSILLTRCDYCRVLHSPLWDPYNHGCGECTHYAALRRGDVNITLPLVRRAVLWHRRGLDANSLLAIVNKNSYAERLHDTGYSCLVDYSARAVGNSVILRQQVLVSRNGPFSGHNGTPSARDIAALSYLPRDLLAPGWLGDVEYHLEDLKNMTTPQCRAFGHLRHPDSVMHGYRCYRDDKGPSRRALRPALRCLLTHRVPYTACPNKNDGLFGRVDGSSMYFEDYSQNAIALPDSPWGRVLVFTLWRDLGDGSSKDDAKWRMQPRPGIVFDGSFAEYRGTHGSRPGDVYEAYEGARQGTPYVPVLSKSVARRLLERPEHALSYAQWSARRAM